jgi:Reverse transcriptase (RNA-dependent DNA polymerase)
MKLEFEMTDLEMMRYFLSLEIKQEKSEIFVSQGAYAREILQKFGLSDCNPVVIPMELGAKLTKLEGGEVMDSNIYTRPDIAFTVRVASRFMEDPRYPHLKAVKKILRYIKGTKTNIFELIGYVDSDWCSDIDDRKNTSGYAFYMGGTTFTWLSKKQLIVTLFTCEAEYVVASIGVSHVIWLRKLLQELKCP